MLVFPDGVTVEVHAYETLGEADTCSIVEAGMDHVTEMVLDGKVAHRSPAPNSLVVLDPCALVSDGDVTAVPGLAGMRRPDNYPETGHIPFTEVAGVVDQVELASVFVNMPPGQSAAACTAAHAVAEVLWPKLPAA